MPLTPQHRELLVWVVLLILVGVCIYLLYKSIRQEYRITKCFELSRHCIMSEKDVINIITHYLSRVRLQNYRKHQNNPNTTDTDTNTDTTTTTTTTPTTTTTTPTEQDIAEFLQRDDDTTDYNYSKESGLEHPESEPPDQPEQETPVGPFHFFQDVLFTLGSMSRQPSRPTVVIQSVPIVTTDDCGDGGGVGDGDHTNTTSSLNIEEVVSDQE